MANKSIILDVGLCKDIKLKDLEKIGYYKHPDEYITELTKCLIYIDPILQLESADKGFFFEISKQDFPIEIEGKKFFVFRICNPIPSDKKEKPSGLVIENDLSFLQFKEILLYDYIEKIMYCFEYSYHYGVWVDLRQVFGHLLPKFFLWATSRMDCSTSQVARQSGKSL